MSQDVHTNTTGELFPIVGVAIKYNGTVYMLPKPNRHHHVIRMIGGIRGADTQGFYDFRGDFLDRKQAYIRAIATGQLKRDPSPLKYQGDQLFSEDLW